MTAKFFFETHTIKVDGTAKLKYNKKHSNRKDPIIVFYPGGSPNPKNQAHDGYC